MSRQDYNVECIKGYGKIIFVRSKERVYCPISGAGYCERCDVDLEKNLGGDRQVKKAET